MLNRYRTALMEGEGTTTTGGQPAAPPSPAAAPTPPPAPAPSAQPALPEDLQKLIANPDAFKQRLADAGAAAQQKMLKDLGFKDAADLKNVLGEFKKLQDAQLSETERLKKQLDELAPKASQAERLSAIVADRAKVEFERLPKVAQDYIAKIAGDDPVARLNAINAASETGMLAALAPQAPAAPTPSPTPPAPPPNPATTIGQPGPATPPPTGTKSELQHYEDLRARGMTRLAAQFYEQHGTAIEQQRAASKKTQ